MDDSVPMSERETFDDSDIPHEDCFGCGRSASLVDRSGEIAAGHPLVDEERGRMFEIVTVEPHHARRPIFLSRVNEPF